MHIVLYSMQMVYFLLLIIKEIGVSVRTISIQLIITGYISGYSLEPYLIIWLLR
jgi:hypothetical protein